MNIHMAKLLTAQRALSSHTVKSPEWCAVIDSLRQSVPAPILAHFLRIVTNGEKGIAEVHQGICTACHIRVPSCQAAILSTEENIHVCEYCGSYLVQPEDEARTSPAQEKTAPHRRERRNTPALVG